MSIYIFCLFFILCLNQNGVHLKTDCTKNTTKTRDAHCLCKIRQSKCANMRVFERKRVMKCKYIYSLRHKIVISREHISLVCINILQKKSVQMNATPLENKRFRMHQKMSNTKFNQNKIYNCNKIVARYG